MGCVVQLAGLSHNDFHFLSQWSLFKSNNYARKIPTSGRKLFCLSLNFGFHLAVVPPSGSSIWWLKKNPDFVQKQKKILPSAHFRLFSHQRTTVLAQFWLFPPTGPLWIMNMDYCVLENRKNNFLEPFLGPKILLQGQKGNFGQKSKFFPIIKNFAPILK